MHRALRPQEMLRIDASTRAASSGYRASAIPPSVTNLLSWTTALQQVLRAALWEYLSHFRQYNLILDRSQRAAEASRNEIADAHAMEAIPQTDVAADQPDSVRHALPE
jgi:hypothetical protein